MGLIYKTLVEIKLLHEYFLTRKDGTTIFSEPDQSARLTFLREEFSNEQEAINEDLDFEFPESLQARYEGLGLKLLPTYSGCRVVVRVVARKLVDQLTVFEPLVTLPSGEDIVILVRRKTLAFDVYTRGRVRRELPATYLFTNTGLGGTRTFPFLTRNVPVQDVAFLYEQGELSLSGATVQEYFRQQVANIWQDVYHDVTGTAFANEGDRILLPPAFDYYFTDTTNLTQASFILTDGNGNIVTTLDRTNAAGLNQKVRLDFSGVINTVPFEGAFTDVTYLLTVNGNNGFTASHTVIFSDDLLRTQPWAVIMVRPQVADSAFNMIAPDGFLIRRKDALGVWTDATVMEIPVKSRLAYWRFVHHKGKALDVSATLTDYVAKEGNVLITQVPRTAARSWFMLSREAPPGTQYVPNPVGPEIKLGADRRMFFDVVVQPSDLFPEAP